MRVLKEGDILINGNSVFFLLLNRLGDRYFARWKCVRTMYGATELVNHTEHYLMYDCEPVDKE
jgi:hypothetical protein